MSDMYVRFAIAGLIIIVLFGFLIWSQVRDFKFQKKTELLFKNRLNSICWEATTLEQVDNAWNTLMDECIYNGHFKISLSYKQDFYNLRSLLQGKLQLLEKL